jgi:hypothetical protein
MSGFGPIDRRSLMLGGSSAGLIFALSSSLGLGQQVLKEIHDLEPGEFTWHPERAPRGPVAAVVSIPEQRVHVYRNGIRIGVSTCSTGKPGHSTPTGVFVVLQKDKHHRSSTYNNAPMPNMNRLTWSGIALHAGNLPGYPASHGCVRLPFEFSAKLFSITHIGTPVIISGSRSDPWELIHPGLVLGERAETTFEAAVAKLKGKMHPSDWSDGQSEPITSLLASAADRSIRLIEDSREIAFASLQISGEPRLGEHVFMLRGPSADAKSLTWHGISHHPDPSQPTAPEEALLQRLTTDPAFLEELHTRLHPGTLLVVTDLPTTPDRRTGSDFVVMADTDA